MAKTVNPLHKMTEFILILALTLMPNRIIPPVAYGFECAGFQQAHMYVIVIMIRTVMHTQN